MTPHRLPSILALVVAMLALPASASAIAPSASTGTPQPTGASSEIFVGPISTGGEDTNYHFEYAGSGDDFCTSGGTSGTPSSSPTQPLSGSSSQNVYANIDGLIAGNIYCYRLVATNGSGTGNGNLVMFTAGRPVVNAYYGTFIDATTATVYAFINGAAQDTTYHFEWDTISSPFCASGGTTSNATPTQSLGFGDATSHSVQANVSGLDARQDYCFAVVADNGSGESRDAANIFGVTFDAFTNAATPTGASTATVTGSVNPAGRTTNVHVDYDLSTNAFCTSGTLGSQSSTSPITLATHVDDQPVSIDISGLTGGQAYCAEVVANDGSTDVRGGRRTFTAGQPTASTDFETSFDATTEQVFGTYNSAGQSGTYHVDYDLATNAFCTSGTLGGQSSTSNVALATDAVDHGVSVNVGSLTEGTQYCAEFVVTNGTATVRGGRDTFTFGFPSASTGNVQITGAGTATVNGSVDDQNQSDTTYHVDYDTDTSAFCTSAGAASLSTSPQSTPFASVNLSGLTSGTAYCAEVVATNAAGTSRGGRNFFLAGAPESQPVNSTSTGADSVHLDASVNPAGQSAEYFFEYDFDSSTWCSSSGSSGSPSFSTSAQPVGVADTSNHPVSADLSGLAPGATYCWAIVTRTGVTHESYQLTFAAGVPAPTTDPPTSASDTSSRLNATINPDGYTSFYFFQWDTSDSAFCTSGGSSGIPANTTSLDTRPVGFTDTSGHSVPGIEIRGLTLGSNYCYRVVSYNAYNDELAFGSVVGFTQVSPPTPTPSAPIPPAPGPPPPVDPCQLPPQTTPLAPVLFKLVVLTPKKQPTTYRLPGCSKTVALKVPTLVPVHTLVDATKGRVNVQSATPKAGGTQNADFYLGKFEIQQNAGDKPAGLTTAVLKGGRLPKCTAVCTSKAKPVPRKLWGSGKGDFRTVGRFASATLRGTTWETVDDPNGTSVRVAKGAVVVRDLVKHKTISLKAGQTYQAPAVYINKRSSNPRFRHRYRIVRQGGHVYHVYPNGRRVQVS